MRRVFTLFLLFVLPLAANAQAPASAPLKTINAITFGGGYNIPA